MDEDFKLVLFDRLNAIRDTIEKYGEDKFYLSFSGGKDSTCLHYLLDLALPLNKIPRVYANTGIEYNKVVEFVKELASEDERIVIIQPKKNIKATLEEKGYPFKSKEYSQWFKIYRNNEALSNEYISAIEKDRSLMNYDFIHNLPNGVKWAVKGYFNLRERESSV